MSDTDKCQFLGGGGQDGNRQLSGSSVLPPQQQLRQDAEKRSRDFCADQHIQTGARVLKSNHDNNSRLAAVSHTTKPQPLHIITSVSAVELDNGPPTPHSRYSQQLRGEIRPSVRFGSTAQQLRSGPRARQRNEARPPLTSRVKRAKSTKTYFMVGHQSGWSAFISTLLAEEAMSERWQRKRKRKKNRKNPNH